MLALHECGDSEFNELRLFVGAKTQCFQSYVKQEQDILGLIFQKEKK